jgi:hypothetical protein
MRVNVGLTLTSAVRARDLRVTVLTADGRTVIADSIAPSWRVCAVAGTCPIAKDFTYRLGGVPADAETVKLTVSLRGRKVASDPVRLTAGSPESGSSLTIRVPTGTKG